MSLLRRRYHDAGNPQKLSLTSFLRRRYHDAQKIHRKYLRYLFCVVDTMTQMRLATEIVFDIFSASSTPAPTQVIYDNHSRYLTCTD